MTTPTTFRPFSVLAALLDLPATTVTPDIDLNHDIQPEVSFEEWLVDQDNLKTTGSIFDDWQGYTASPEMLALAQEQNDLRHGYSSPFRSEAGIKAAMLRTVRIVKNRK